MKRDTDSGMRAIPTPHRVSRTPPARRPGSFRLISNRGGETGVSVCRIWTCHVRLSVERMDAPYAS